MAGDVHSSSHGARGESIRVVAVGTLAGRLYHGIKTHIRRTWISDVIWACGPLSTKEIADLAATHQRLTRAQVERLLTDMRQDGVLVAVEVGVNRALWWSEPGQPTRPRAVERRIDRLWPKRSWGHVRRRVPPETWHADRQQPPAKPSESWWVSGSRDQFTQRARQRFQA